MKAMATAMVALGDHEFLTVNTVAGLTVLAGWDGEANTDTVVSIVVIDNDQVSKRLLCEYPVFALAETVLRCGKEDRSAPMRYEELVAAVCPEGFRWLP